MTKRYNFNYKDIGEWDFWLFQYEIDRINASIEKQENKGQIINYNETNK